MIRANRSLLKNPNGLILGTPGAGKSFSVKREILDCFLTTTDDIIICDPEGEYFPLVSALHGQLIRIASNSEQHVNPMDITIDEYLFSNPMEVIANKSDFLISLCEIIVGGRYGLSSEERSIIDKCVQRIYKHFIENNPTEDTMPLLSDLQKELQSDRDILAEKLHISKEQMKYVTNSGQGEGLIRYDKMLLPFTDQFPTDTKIYKLITTKPLEST